MDYSATFARHFVRLVWLLSNEPANIDEQKAALRALVTVAREGFVSLGERGGQLTANGTALPTAFPGVADVVTRMAVHRVKTIEVDRSAGAADVLRIARQLVGTTGDGPSPPGSTARLSVDTPTTASAAAPEATRASALPDMDFGEMLDDPLAAVPERRPPSRAEPSVADQSSRARHDPSGMFDHFAAARTSSATPKEVLVRLDSESSPTALIALLDELVTRAERAMGAGQPALATEIFHRIVRRERDAHDFEVKRAFVLSVKRLTKPALLKAVVLELARERREESLVVLARTGEDGADALIEQLAEEEVRRVRLSYFDALVHLQAGVPTLIHMLGDARWYVARNAAALLGEMQAHDAEKPLAALLHHDDERVRHAATVSLMWLDTPRALPTIHEALTDVAPQMRMQAAAALVKRTESNVADTLLRALDEERDDEVSAAFLIALGRMGTPSAVARLIATAEPDKGMFRKKPVALRVAAVQALSEARSDEALAALTMLQGDKDEDVRATAVYALGRRARGGGESEKGRK